MKHKTWVIGLVIIIALQIFYTNANAGVFTDSQQLRSYSDAYSRMSEGRGRPDDEGWSMLYMGFVMGVHDSGVELGLFCTRQRTTVDQIAMVVRNYLLKNPRHWDKPAHQLAALALVENFPCSR